MILANICSIIQHPSLKNLPLFVTSLASSGILINAELLPQAERKVLLVGDDIRLTADQVLYIVKYSKVTFDDDAAGLFDSKELGSGVFGKVLAVFNAENSLDIPIPMAAKLIAKRRSGLAHVKFLKFYFLQNLIIHFLKIQREVDIMQQIDHVHVLNIIGYDTSRPRHAIIFIPLMAGGNLSDWIKNNGRRLSEANSKFISFQALIGLN